MNSDTISECSPGGLEADACPKEGVVVPEMKGHPVGLEADAYPKGTEWRWSTTKDCGRKKTDAVECGLESDKCILHEVPTWLL
ncbi:hypothetical protein NDU88_010342 [Pleurodeles waltl]|uniref:Uncharacterized protein n=1 Tax=Pleurodeles waltl TaxID=8319 RepID=A0AAV7QXZ3_PLEWA|nr:hypothetical protein NDU88_010342 [Pleurodeles waltl]